MQDILFIMGQPNVGKTTLINRLLQIEKFTLPIHYTNRPPRKDDNGFYTYVNKSFFTEENMFLWSSDSYDRYYGVQNFVLFTGNSEKIFIVNCSIKNISQVIQLKKLYKDHIRICILLSQNPISKIENSNTKYDAEEIKYRIQETENELILLNKYISQVEDFIFYCENYMDLEKIIKNLAG